MSPKGECKRQDQPLIGETSIFYDSVSMIITLADLKSVFLSLLQRLSSARLPFDKEKEQMLNTSGNIC